MLALASLDAIIIKLRDTSTPDTTAAGAGTANRLSLLQIQTRAGRARRVVST